MDEIKSQIHEEKPKIIMLYKELKTYIGSQAIHWSF